MPITFATATDTGRVRRTNEDSWFAQPPVFAVADGMGGAEAGEVASAMATGLFQKFQPGPDQPQAQLAALIDQANRSIYDYSVSDAGHAGMGTTITAATVIEDAVIIAHVGDSRAWLLRGGKLSRLTEDHSLVAEMVRGGQLTETEAADHPQRSIITRALGVEPTVKVDTMNVDWQEGDVFLLASDGLYSMVPEADIETILARAGDLNIAAGELVESANINGGKDNITVVLFSPDGSVAGEVRAAKMAGDGHEDPAPAQPAVDQTRASPGQRFRARMFSPAGLIVIGTALVILILGGAWFASRYAFYVGVEENRVSLYQGLPYNLGPVSLSQIYRGSTVDFQDLEPFEQERVSRQEIQSRNDAETMLDNIIAADGDRKAAREQLLKEEAARNMSLQNTVTVPAGGAS
ncbi:MAG: Stp1/IreP family PP2C-type Ser/Thr phosphatase [Thermoleophilia bacterium]